MPTDLTTIDAQKQEKLNTSKRRFPEMPGGLFRLGQDRPLENPIWDAKSMEKPAQQGIQRFFGADTDGDGTGTGQGAGKPVLETYDSTFVGLVLLGT